MDVGAAVVYQATQWPGRPRTDREIYQNELRLGDLVEPLGFDSIWGVEHHFTDYLMLPDVLQHLTYFAGRTKRIKLGTCAVILPWHDPLRVAEQISMLDHMSDGRLIVGLGRGIGRVEYDGFRVEQSTSRERFAESAQMLVEGLESGTFEFNGRIIKQVKRQIRPRPFKSFRGRMFGAAVSAESAEIMAKLGLGMLISTQRPWKDVGEDVTRFRHLYRELHGSDPPAPVFSSHVYCDTDPGRAEAMAHQYMGAYYDSVLKHYEIVGNHFEGLKGHEHYAAWQKSVADKSGVDKQREDFLKLLIWGTPEQCYEKALYISTMIGAGTLVGMFSYAGMPYDDAERNLRLFASEVMPRLKKATITS